MATPADYFATVYPFVSRDPESITRYEGNGDHKTAFVFFGGAQDSATALSAPLRDQWLQRDDVVVVEFNRILFDGDQTSYDTYRKLHEWGYEKVILDGASIGGRVATGTIDCDRKYGLSDYKKNLKFAVMLQDAPVDIEDLYQRDSAKSWSTVWWAGQMTNLLLTRLFWDINFNPPPRDQLGAGVDDNQLAAQYEASRTYPLSGWLGQIRYIDSRSDSTNKIAPKTYYDVPLVLMQSDGDTVVKPTADRWGGLFASMTVIPVHSGHIDFVENPGEWRTAFGKGFEALSKVPGW